MREQRATEDAARLEALRGAAGIGWNDIEADRYVDIAAEDLESFIADLGRLAAARIRAISHYDGIG